MESNNIKDWMHSPNQMYYIVRWADGSIGEWSVKIETLIPDGQEIISPPLTASEIEEWLCGVY
jgi:hypothetical protein